MRLAAHVSGGTGTPPLGPCISPALYYLTFALFHTLQRAPPITLGAHTGRLPQVRLEGPAPPASHRSDALNGMQCSGGAAGCERRAWGTQRPCKAAPRPQLSRANTNWHHVNALQPASGAFRRARQGAAAAAAAACSASPSPDPPLPMRRHDA